MYIIYKCLVTIFSAMHQTLHKKFYLQFLEAQKIINYFGACSLSQQISKHLCATPCSHLKKRPELACLASVSLTLQGSLRKEFPQNIGGSDVCFFCRKRVYVMERLSAEGKFFHRSCFKCDYCGTTLRLSSYAFDVEDGTKPKWN